MARAKSTKSARKPSGRGKRGVRRAPARKQAPVEAALAALAHEVRTPLTGILALAELLAASDLPERERQWAGAVKSAAEHLAHLTTLVVDGAKARRRRLTSPAGRFRPANLAQAVATLLAARAEAKGLSASITIPAELPGPVTGDPVRLRAALENLIDNAIKFTERGEIGFEVEAKPAGRRRTRLIFTVRDSGIGLTRAEINRLFRPFAQASERIAARYGGAGLGLVFVKRLARAMQGDLTVTSAPGHGSTFQLTVVVKHAEESDSASAGPSRTAGVREAPARSLAILCVEDNPYGRVILNTILTQLGHRTDFVGSGEAAVDAVGEGSHDLVLMDITLPGIDGLEATRRIRALPGRPGQVPIIGISGRTAPDEDAAARAAGMNDYLVKPVSPSALVEVIAAHGGE